MNTGLGHKRKNIDILADVYHNFHVEYAEYEAAISIQDCIVNRGYLPNKQLKMVLAWCEIHKDELMQNWELVKAGQPLNNINPLV
jgi:hypothetical protein